MPPDEKVVSQAQKQIGRTLRKGIERMKTSDQPVTALLVGGGSVIQVDDLEGVMRCIRPPFHDVANAMGPAIAKIAGEVDCIQIPGVRTQEQLIHELEAQAAQAAINNGAQPSTVQTIEVELTPLAYMSNGAVRARVKAVGDLSWKWEGPDTGESDDVDNEETTVGQKATPNGAEKLDHDHESPLEFTIHSNLSRYRSTVKAETGEWLVSETDLAFIAEGVGVLGTGGGGSVRGTYLDCIKYLQANGPGRMRIIDPAKLASSDRVAMVAGTGAP
ncbi:hypothetical protein LTR44_011456 [Exophiala sp. CCFEE 6388]|nr:hypothetical protein LTR44_011456 [Eurotiomycetes sp. CCFEE 6388]